MPISVGEVVKITYFGRALSQRIIFARHYYVLNEVLMQPIEAILFNVAANYNAIGGHGTIPQITYKYLLHQPTGYRLEKVSAQCMKPLPSVRVDSTLEANGGGGAGPDATNLCATFALTTNRLGRAEVAKYHPGPLPSSRVVDGLLSAGGQTALQELALACLETTTTDMGAQDPLTLAPIIWHGPNRAPTLADLVVLVRLNKTVRTERRRTIGLGE